MPTEQLPLGQKAQDAFNKLSQAASNLNTVSDELNRPIEQLDGALKKLSLGVSAWVSFNNGGHDSYPWSEDIGYDRCDGKWGIAIREWQIVNSSGDEDCESWLFADAPRRLRIKAVAKIPELLEKLATEADKMAAQITAEVGKVSEVAGAVVEASKSVQPKRK